MGCGASKNDTTSSTTNSSNNTNNIDTHNVQPNTVPHAETGDMECLGKKEPSENDVVEENLDSSACSPEQSPNSTQLPQKLQQKKEADPLKGLGDSDDDDDEEDENEQDNNSAPLSPFKKPANAASSSPNNSNSASAKSFNKSSNNNRKKSGADDIILEDAFDELEDDTFPSGSLRRRGSQHGSFMMKKHGSGIFGPRGNQSMRKPNTTSLSTGFKTLVTSGPSSPNSATIGVASPASMKPGKFAMNKPPAGSTMQHAVKVAGAQGANFGGFAAAPRKK